MMAVELALSVQFHKRISPIWEQFYDVGALVYSYALRAAQICSLSVFLGAMLAFRARFRLLNEAFRDVFLQKECSLDDDDAREHLRKIATGHDALTEAVDLFSDVCCLQMVYACTTYVMFSIFSMFCIGALVSCSAADVVFLSLIYTSAFLQYSMHILPIIKISTDVRNEGKQIAVLVHKAINQSSLSVGSINRVSVVRGYASEAQSSPPPSPSSPCWFRNQFCRMKSIPHFRYLKDSTEANYSSLDLQ